MGIQLSNQLGNIVYGVVYTRVFIIMIEFVADDPEQYCGVIAVLHYFATNELQLRRHGFLVVVIETVSLVLHLQTQRDGHAVGMRFIEQCQSILFFLRRIPDSDRVATRRGKALDVVDYHPRAPDLIGLATAQQLVAAVGVYEFNRYRLESSVI